MSNAIFVCPSAGIAMGDSNGGGTIAVGNGNGGGGAMDGEKAARS